MSFDQDLAASVRAALAGAGAVGEIRMFGGIGFTLNGNMVAGASRRGLLVRVGKERQREALGRSGARPMVMRERVMEGYIYVDPPAITDDAVRAWIGMAVAFVSTLPAKPAKAAATSDRSAKGKSVSKRADAAKAAKIKKATKEAKSKKPSPTSRQRNPLARPAAKSGRKKAR